MIYISTKKYQVVSNETKGIISLCKNKEINIQNDYVFFDSDLLSDCIDYLLNKSIFDFFIPNELYGLEIENIKKNPVYNYQISKYENGEPISENTLVGYVEETNPDIVLQRKISLLNWVYPKRTIRLTGSVTLFFTGGDYAAFKNQIDMRKTPIEYNGKDDTSTIYFEYIEKTDGLFSLTNQVISCADPRLKIEQLYDSGYEQDAAGIYRL